MIQESVAPTTAKMYTRVLRKLRKFCHLHYIKDKFSASTIEIFVMQLKTDGLSFGAIRSSLSAIRLYCKKNPYLVFDTVRLPLFMRRIQ